MMQLFTIVPSTGFSGDNFLSIRIIFPLLVGLIVFNLNFGLGGCQWDYCSKDKIVHDDLSFVFRSGSGNCALNRSRF